MEKGYAGKGKSQEKPVLEFRYPARHIFFWWNLLEKIEHLIGMRPVTAGITGNEILIKFSRPVDSADIKRLNKLMEEPDPSLPPESPTVLIINDLEQEYIKLGPRLFIGSSDGVSRDRLEIHYDVELDSMERIAILEKYRSLARFRGDG